MATGPDDEFPRLLAEVRACTLCAAELPVDPRPVLRAHPAARILIASQAPGRKVHETGIPFNDPSGKRLRDWLGVSPEEFYDEKRVAIVPMGFCFPGTGKGGDLPPRPECAERWRAPVLGLLQRIELVVAVGSYAVVYHTGERKPLSETVREWRRWGPGLIPLPHPSPRNTRWLQKNDWFEREVVPGLRTRIREILGDATT